LILKGLNVLYVIHKNKKLRGIVLQIEFKLSCDFVSVMMLQATPPGSTTTPVQVLWSSTIASQPEIPTMTMQLCLLQNGS
jgi:hypothetical protein